MESESPESKFFRYVEWSTYHQWFDQFWLDNLCTLLAKKGGYISHFAYISYFENFILFYSYKPYFTL